MNIRNEIQTTFQNMVLEEETNITVSQICRKMNISRKTFYKYYADIYDLISYIIHENIFVSLTQLSHMNQIKVEDSITVLNSMYSHIYEQRDFYKNLYYLFYDSHIFNKCIYQENLKLNENIFNGIYKNELEKEYHIHLAAMSGVNLLEKWIIDDFELSSREIAEIFYKYVARAWVEFIEQYK